MTLAVLSPLRRIELTTVDDVSYIIEEFHGFTTLTKTFPDGTVESFDNVEIEYQDLYPGSSFSWNELVFDGSVFVHDARAIATAEIL